MHKKLIFQIISEMKIMLTHIEEMNNAISYIKKVTQAKGNETNECN